MSILERVVFFHLKHDFKALLTFVYLQAHIQSQEIKEYHEIISNSSGQAPSIRIVNNQTPNASLERNSSVSTAVCLEANNTEQETSSHSNNAEPMLTHLDLRFGKTECAHVNNLKDGGNGINLQREDCSRNRSTNIDRVPLPPSQTINVGKTIPDFKDGDYIQIHIDPKLKGIPVFVP
ncbi:unnamed protein product [Mytilus coruscus]|uniref:Uncharacterized protein n=1 Tax=Mytilus coruscus TaxID=42192 RepID=A0A6J8CZS4_MYTCO|nr:unnamed protein product [Mytilus coruscus]